MDSRFEFPYVIGYGDGIVKTIKNTPKNIAKFIMCYGKDQDLVITTPFDEALISTFGVFINHCVSQEYLLDELSPILVPMQMEEINVKAEEIEYCEA